MNIKKYLLVAVCLPAVFSSTLPAQGEVSSSDKEPVLRELRANKYATGTVEAEIDGKKVEFMTTSETIHVSEERINAAPEGARAFLKKMNGKTVHTAALRSVGDLIHVGIDAYGDIQKDGPKTSGDKATSLKISFALKPETLELQDKQRQISYAAPGQSTSDQSVGKEIELTLDSITKLPDGSLALKGSFSAVLTETMMSKDLKKPVNVKGTFDIQRASSDKVIPGLLSGK